MLPKRNTDEFEGNIKTYFQRLMNFARHSKRNFITGVVFAIGSHCVRRPNKMHEHGRKSGEIL